MKNRSPKQRIIILLIEVLVYAGVMALYIKFVLQNLREPLLDLFRSSNNLYSAAVVLLIVIQAVLLEFSVSFLLRSLGIFKIRE